MKQVTVKEARDILGDEAVKMSDEEVQQLIEDLSVMARWALKEASQLRSQGASSFLERSKNDSTEL